VGALQLTSVYHSAHTLQPWPGFGVMCLLDRRRMMARAARKLPDA